MECRKQLDHFICYECADSAVQSLDADLVDGPNDLSAQDWQVQCLHTDCDGVKCVGVFDHADLFHILPKETVRRWLELWKVAKEHDEDERDDLRKENRQLETSIDEKIFEGEKERFIQDNDEPERHGWPQWWDMDTKSLRVPVKDPKEQNYVRRKFEETLTCHSHDNPACACTEWERGVGVINSHCQVEEDFQILQIERVQNIELWNSYEAYMRNMVFERLHSEPAERMLFHGTREDNIDSIVQNNFNRDYAGANATRYGKGCYFAAHSEYSADKRQDKREKYSPENAKKEKFMFLCRVMVGDFCVGRENAKGPDKVDPDNSYSRLYDTTVDNKDKPTIFVTYNDAQVYPEYIITFKDLRPRPHAPPPSPPPVMPPTPPTSAPPGSTGKETRKKKDLEEGQGLEGKLQRKLEQRKSS